MGSHDLRDLDRTFTDADDRLTEQSLKPGLVALGKLGVGEARVALPVLDLKITLADGVLVEVLDDVAGVDKIRQIRLELTYSGVQDLPRPLALEGRGLRHLAGTEQLPEGHQQAQRNRESTTHL
jgi:hypothetical protein